MNFHVLNGATLNGSRVGAILAAAAILCSASVSVVGAKQQDALAPTSSSCQISASAIRVSGAQAALLTEGLLAASPRQTRAAIADAGGSASVRAFVLREASGFSVVNCTASVVAIPASTLGSSSISGGASLASEATKIQHGRAFAQAGCAVDASGIVVTRYVLSDGGPCAATLRIEPAINGVSYSYTDIKASGGINILAVGLVSRNVRASIYGSMDAVASATHIKPGSGTVETVGALFVASPHIEAVSRASAEAACVVTASGDRVLKPMASASCSSIVSATARQRHGSSAAAAACSASLSAAGQVRRVGRLTGSGSAEMSAAAVRIIAPEIVAGGAAGLVARAERSTHSSGEFAGLAIIEDVDSTVFRLCSASIDVGAGVVVRAIRILPSGAEEHLDVEASSALAADASVTRMVEVADAGGSADISAECLRTAFVGALVDVTCFVDADPVRTTFSSGDFVGTSVMEAALGLTERIAEANAGCSAGIEADAVRFAMPITDNDIACLAAIDAQPFVTRPAASSLTGFADVHAQALRTVRAAASIVSAGFGLDADADVYRSWLSNVHGSAIIAADAVRVVVAAVDSSSASSAAIATTPVVTRMASAPVSCIADVLANQLRTTPASAAVLVDLWPVDAEATVYRVANAAASGGALISVVSDRRTAGAANVDASTSVSASPALVIFARAFVSMYIEIDADTISNPGSLDPQDRTFIRPSAEVLFIRPQQETIFRRAA